MFTSAEIKRADAAYKALRRLCNSTVDDFDKMVRVNQIQNFPITPKDITNAKVIFIPHLVWLRGKKVRCTPKRVDSYRVVIPRSFQLLNKSVTLVSDVFFVNEIICFVALFRKIFL